jgi:RNA recognition motif-containing protein
MAVYHTICLSIVPSSNCRPPLCRDGRSRCFGFVGYASTQQAASAVTYFHRTFMDASRLEVEFAYKYGAADLKKQAWSKYTEGTSANKRLQGTGANTVPLAERDAAALMKKKAKVAPEKNGEYSVFDSQPASHACTPC